MSYSWHPHLNAPASRSMSGENLRTAAGIWLGALRSNNAIPDLGCPSAEMPMLHDPEQNKYVKSRLHFLSWNRSSAILTVPRFQFYVTHFGHNPGKGMDPSVKGTFLSYNTLITPWTPPMAPAPPADGSAEPELRGVHLFELYGYSRTAVPDRLYNELRAVQLHHSQSASSPTLAVQMKEVHEGHVLPPNFVEQMWRDWQLRKRRGAIYTLLKFPGMQTELLRILVHGASADFAFVQGDMLDLFKQFLSEKGYSDYLIRDRHLT